MFTINITLPALDDLSLKEVKKALDSFREASAGGPVRGGVASVGEASAYALVWEWGNSRQTQKGPKTVLGTNPDGSQVWLSLQAPFGYIRIHEPEYIQILEKELEAMDFDALDARDIRTAMELAAIRAGEKMAALIRETVPLDSGDLKESIVAMDSDDPDLEKVDEGLELGSEFFSHDSLK